MASYISGNLGAGSVRTLTMTLYYRSTLPVRGVLGHLHDAKTGERVAEFPSISVVETGPRVANPTVNVPIEASPDERELVLQLDFDDDAGVRWRKYESHEIPLRRLTPNES